ncbi:hypothetical protein BC833DRAFT_630742 [Globomyces pollinis-pini]|nr:hypothetical protein BC833DRAFT_630742 [Globomyces pollinis-pini]
MLSITLTLVALLSPALAVQNINTCPPLPKRASKPTSVHDVRIDDIKVVAAIGDSITAGFGAAGSRGPLSLKNLYEQRGLSWSMGSDAGTVSIANFIKNYNPNVIGGSVGEHIVNVCYGPLCPPFQYKPDLDRFNAARSGALAANLPDEVDWLVKQMKNNPNVDMANDYKLINLFIGSNDVCLGCQPVLKDFVLTGDQFESTMRDVLFKIQWNIPKAIVNIHQQFDVAQVYDLTRFEPKCIAIRAASLGLLCPCAFQPLFADRNRRAMKELAAEYNRRLEKIQKDFLANKNDNFMYVLNPSFRDVNLKQWDMSYISDIDCFHPSTKTHQLMAVSSWNNLFVPFEQRATSVAPNIKTYCPTEDSRIRV